MFTHVLVPLDTSALAECVIPHAVAVARAFEAHMTLLHVAEAPKTNGELAAVDPIEWEFLRVERQAYLDVWAERLQRAGLDVTSALLDGEAPERTATFAREARADLIVLSSHGQSGLTPWNVNSVAQKILMQAATSILLVRAYQPRRGDQDTMSYQHILVPLDGSQRAEYALPVADILAQTHGGHIQLVHVVCRPEMLRRKPLSSQERDLLQQVSERNRQEAMAYLEEIQSHLSAESDVRVLERDNTTEALLDIAEDEDVDLVVMSAHGSSGGQRRASSSMATSFMTYGATPLLVLQDFPPEQIRPTQAELASQELRGHLSDPVWQDLNSRQAERRPYPGPALPAELRARSSATPPPPGPWDTTF
jgi:nucleotide-binding universal stress UspA family protein